MSFMLVTQNRGEVDGFGFMSTDTTKVMLGELPSIWIGQFCVFASETIVSFVKGVPPEDRDNLDRKLRFMFALDKKLEQKIRRTDNPLNLPRDFSSNLGTLERELGGAIFADKPDDKKVSQLLEELHLAANNYEGGAILYKSNPFVIQDGLVVIGDTYVVEPFEFISFALSYLTGGMSGWDERGIPDYAHRALTEVLEVLAS